MVKFLLNANFIYLNVNCLTHFVSYMSIYFASLNSGSNGNCYFIGNDEEAVFIDAGLSCKETENRMKMLGISMKKIKAIFISHEHIDHVKGVEVLAKKYELPVYISSKTKENCRTPIPTNLIQKLSANSTTQIGNLAIKSFSKFHDAKDPCSFVITSGSCKVGVFTDIGYVCENVISHFKDCNAVFLEANYDEEMLENGPYPFHLKKRISSDVGHLSNKQAMELFVQHRSPKLSHLLLSHLSKENNSPELAAHYFKTQSTHTKIIVASRYKPTEIYSIHPLGIKNKTISQSKQLQLF